MNCIDGKTVGLMGSRVSNPNMGCCALTYSLLQLLENLYDGKLQYVIFDYAVSEDSIKRLCSDLNIDKSRIRMSRLGRIDTHDLNGLVHTILRTPRNIKMIKDIEACSCVIDLTAGDSFADVYGLRRFYELTNIKLITEKHGVPLILGPQTYGPFENAECKKLAKRVIEKAFMVIARDEISRDYLKTFSNKDVSVGTDLAFGLKYNKPGQKNNGKIRVGLNVSALLHSAGDEVSFSTDRLKTNYDQYIKNLVDYILSDDIYELHIIPHVGNEANHIFEKYQNVQVHKAFTSPIDAKSLIASMDIFIGSRMHATIGAFSAGVATIPVAYTRKFSGLFKSLGYDHIVDLEKLSTEEAVEKTVENIQNYKKLTEQVNKCSAEVKKRYQVIIDAFDRLPL